MDEYLEFIEDFKRMCELYSEHSYTQSDVLREQLYESMDDIRRLNLKFD